MLKYSRFGLAFTKDFLVDLGASPVMNVPGRGRPALLPFHQYGPGIVSLTGVRVRQTFFSGTARSVPLKRSG